MKRILISIDWDYFIQNKSTAISSFRENYRSIYLRWYREYLKNPRIKFLYGLLPHPENFWRILRQDYTFSTSTLLFISDSHKYSWNLSKILGCQKVLNFDAHADLGYSRVKSIGYYTHCANWLGRLLQKDIINEAVIVYSPYTAEKAANYQELMNDFNLSFTSLGQLDSQTKDELVAGIHICRSGAWTPPWYDQELTRFISASHISGRRGFIKARPWRPQMLNYSKQIDLLLCS